MQHCRSPGRCAEHSQPFGCQTTPPWTTAAQTQPARRGRASLPLARSVTTLPSYSIKRKTLRQRLDRISVSSKSHGGQGRRAGTGRGRRRPYVQAVLRLSGVYGLTRVYERPRWSHRCAPKSSGSPVPGKPGNSPANLGPGPSALGRARRPWAGAVGLGPHPQALGRTRDGGPSMLLGWGGQPQRWPIDATCAPTMAHRCGFLPAPEQHRWDTVAAR